MVANVNFRGGLLISLVVIIIDQIIKYYTTLFPLGEQKILIPGTLLFTHITNTGISFGQFQGNNLLMILVVFIVFGLLIYWYNTFKTQLSQVSYWLIIGGLFGNLIDRLFRGAVTDMFNVPWFAVFNIADAAISIAVVLLVYEEIQTRIVRKNV